MTLAHDRTTQFLEGTRRQQRTIVTPEGVPVTVELADHGERLTALTIDVCIWLLLTILIYLPLFFMALRRDAALFAISVVLFVGFVVRNLYFIHFELAWRGATPGKRFVGLRVIDRRGGPLLPSAVIARNLTREVEAFIPLGILLTWGGAKQGAPNEPAAAQTLRTGQEAVRPDRLVRQGRRGRAREAEAITRRAWADLERSAPNPCSRH